jgi:PAS domain S-box-containing protein
MAEANRKESSAGRSIGAGLAQRGALWFPWPLPGWLNYVIAALLTLATLAGRMLLDSTPGESAVLIVFVLPIIVSAYLGGLGPGLLSTAIAGLGTTYFLLPPLHSLEIARPASLGRWLILLIDGTLISMLTEALHRARRQSQAGERLRAVALTSIGDAVITTDKDGFTTFLNPEAERLTGWPSAEAKGLHLARVFQIVEESTRAPAQDPVAKALRSGTVVGLANHTLLLARDGRETPIADSAAPIRETGGAVEGVILVFRDCSAERAGERLIRRSQEQLLALVEQAPVSMAMFDRDMCYLAASRRWRAQYGRADQDLIGRRHYDVHPDLPEKWKQAHRRGLAGEVLQEEEDLWMRADGSKRWMRWAVHPWRTAAEEVGGIIITNEDATARKQMDELQLRSRKLEALGTLAGGIAHDFNNVLLAISGNVKLATLDLPPDHEAQTSLAEIAKASSRGAALVRRILTFSRPQERKVEVVQLKPVVEEALELLRATLPATIDISTDFTGEALAVEADPTQVHEVIVNLATNAAHAIGQRRGLIHVRLEPVQVSARLGRASPDLRQGLYSCLSVSDDGCGMNDAILERIFDPFFTTKLPAEGTGLGLSVVHGIMKTHGGAITVHSSPGKGTTFRLYFPATGLLVDVPAAPARDAAPGRGERVLYVDDDEALVALATRMLVRCGYEVIGYTDSADAVEEFRRRSPDFAAVVTDLSMPRMSGFELAREVLAIRPDVPIIMTTGYLRPEDQETAQRLGIRDLILKPDTAEELGHVLDRLFRTEAARS